MSRLALLGANGQVGRSVLARYRGQHEILCYVRDPERAASLLRPDDSVTVHGLSTFGQAPIDAIIHAAGPGDPVRLRQMGAEILRITEYLDNLVTDYVEAHPHVTYIYCSTGAIYGGAYEHAFDTGSTCQFPVNALGPLTAYRTAKLVAETKHRCLADLPITDLRIFGFVSPFLDPDSGFFLSSILKALHTGTVFETGAHNFHRDVIGPAEFTAAVDAILTEPRNGAFDVVSAQPFAKSELIPALTDHFGLTTHITGDGDTIEPMPRHIFGPMSEVRLPNVPMARTSLRIILDEFSQWLKTPSF